MEGVGRGEIEATAHSVVRKHITGGGWNLEEDFYYRDEFLLLVTLEYNKLSISLLSPGFWQTVSHRLKSLLA